MRIPTRKSMQMRNIPMKTKKLPQRKCVGCNEMKDKRELVRIVKTPEDAILLDVTGRANGRGAYLCRSMECLRLALRNKGIERSLKCQLTDEIKHELEQEMGKSVTG